MNREQWLTEIADRIAPYFKRKGYFPQAYRLTCGWPCRGALAAKNRRLGECHSSASSSGKVREVFVSPLVDDGSKVAGIVAHELVHASLDAGVGHKGPFVQAMRHLGFVGKPTCTVPGKDLTERLAKIIEEIGAYPHQALRPAARVVKTGTTVRLVCGECGCKVSMSRSWYDRAGAPTCGCGAAMETVE